MENRQVATLGE